MEYKTKGKKGKMASSCAEDTRDLLKLALEEKPNAFREVFDEIMLAKIVDISDEMKDEISQSMFGESSHEYGKKKKKHDKKKMEESFEPDEDEDEDDVGDEDEDFDISDEDLEDLDLDDLDFEEDEDEIEESMDKVIGDIPFAELTRNTTTRERQQMVRDAAAQKEIVDRFVTGVPEVRRQISAMQGELKRKGYRFPPENEQNKPSEGKP